MIIILVIVITTKGQNYDKDHNINNDDFRDDNNAINTNDDDNYIHKEII